MEPCAVIQGSILLQPHRTVVTDFAPGNFVFLRRNPGWKTSTQPQGTFLCDLPCGCITGWAALSYFGWNNVFSCFAHHSRFSGNAAWRVYFGHCKIRKTTYQKQFRISPSCWKCLVVRPCRRPLFCHSTVEKYTSSLLQ